MQSSYKGTSFVEVLTAELDVCVHAEQLQPSYNVISIEPETRHAMATTAIEHAAKIRPIAKGPKRGGW